MLLPLHRAIHATATQSSHILAVLDFCRHHCHCHTEQSYFGCARFLPSPLPLPHSAVIFWLCSIFAVTTATAAQSSYFCRHHCHCHTERSYFGCARFFAVTTATAAQSSYFCRHHCHCHTERSYFRCARFLPSPLPLPHRRYGVALCPFLPLQSSDSSCFALEVFIFIFFFLFNKTPRLSSYRGDAFFPPARFHAVNFPIGTYTSPPHPPPPTHTQKDVYNEPCDI